MQTIIEAGVLTAQHVSTTNDKVAGCLAGAIIGEEFEAAARTGAPTPPSWASTRRLAESIILHRGEIDNGIPGVGQIEDPAGPSDSLIYCISPVAVASSLLHRSKYDLYGQCVTLCNWSKHGKGDAISAFAVARLIDFILNAHKRDRDGIKDLVRHAKIEVEYYENLSVADNESPLDTSVSTMLTMVLQSESLDSSALRAKIGYGTEPFAVIAFACGILLRHPRDFRNGILDCVNADPERCAINASVAGTLIGCNCGFDAIPPGWIGLHPAIAEAKEVAMMLTALPKRPA